MREGKWRKRYGELIYCDVWGPAKVKMRGRMRYFITFTDSFCCKTHIHLMATKDQALNKYQSFEAWYLHNMAQKSKLSRVTMVVNSLMLSSKYTFKTRVQM
jgi:hypothetical protein